MIALRPLDQFRMGQRKKLSFYDKKFANAMYSCSGRLPPFICMSVCQTLVLGSQVFVNSANSTNQLAKEYPQQRKWLSVQRARLKLIEQGFEQYEPSFESERPRQECIFVAQLCKNLAQFNIHRRQRLLCIAVFASSWRPVK